MNGDTEAIRADRQKANRLAERILERQFPHEREPDDDGEKALYQCRHCGCIAFFDGPCPIRVVNELDALRSWKSRAEPWLHVLAKDFGMGDEPELYMLLVDSTTSGSTPTPE